MDAKIEIIYQAIKQVAKNEVTTYYSDIAPLVGLDMSYEPDRNIMSNILDKISKNEHENGKPLLSAVVILRDKNIPGDGFFGMAQEVGVYNGGDKDQFWASELWRVYNYWAKQE